MKTLIAFYSLSGHTKKLCERLKTDGCDLVEIKELSKRSTFEAYTKGCFEAIRKHPSAIGTIDADLSSYDQIVLACPVWAGNIAPAGMAFLQKFELSGKEITVIAISRSGHDYSQNIKALFGVSKAALKSVVCLKEDQMPNFPIF